MLKPLGSPNPNMWYVYIIECGNKSLYTGITLDIDRRFQEHKRGIGASYTRSFGVAKIVYREKCGTRAKALKREALIKSWPKHKKLTLIFGNSEQ